ncbi:MAG: hypothetical protein ACMUIG_04465 [Thermoplasmatota archaeon]
MSCQMRRFTLLIMTFLILPIIIRGSVLGIDYIEDPVADHSISIEDPFPGSLPRGGSNHFSDINGDGIGDMILSYPENGSGAVVVYLSCSRNLTSVIRGNASADPIGRSVFTSDITGDGAADLLINVGTEGLAVFKSPVSLPPDINIASADLFLSVPHTGFCPGDIDGDGVDDLVFYDSGGSTIDIIDGPVGSSNDTIRSDVFDAGFEIGEVVLEGDLDGDGIVDPIITGSRNSTSRMICVGSNTDGIILNLSTERSIDSASAGDLDGDGIDDLLVLSENATSFGGIFAGFSDELNDIRDMEDFDWNIAGTSSYPVRGDYVLHMLDADADGSDDILIGSPGYGPGLNKVSLYYSGPRDWSENITIDSEDASLIEESDVTRFGRFIFSSTFSVGGPVVVWLDSAGGLVEWDIDGSGFGPVITPPSIDEWPQNEDLVLDFDCSSEGDGQTVYSLVKAPAGTTINEDLGLVGFYPTEADVGLIYFEVRATDGNGTSSVYNHTVEITNVPPVLTGNLPSTLEAGRPVLFHLQTTEDGYVSFSADRSFPFAAITDISSGRISGFPLKQDRGNYSMNITIRDEHGGMTEFTWNFSVAADENMIDPSFSITDARISGKSALILFNISIGSVRESDIGSAFNMVNYRIKDQDGDVISGLISPGDNYTSIDLESLIGNLTVTAWINALGRNYSAEYQFEYDPQPRERNDPYLPVIWTTIFFIIIISLIVILIILASIERTSYVFQSVLLPGGSRRDEEVIGLIHEIPGIRFREISRRSQIPRRDLLVTLRENEDSRMIYGMFDGLNVRFYPLMGSFRDRPLTLNRYQRRIAQELIEGGVLGEEELLVLTGMSGSRLRKELSLMDLKGVVTVIQRKGSKRYSVNRVQKERLERVMAGS